jgi:hypothetical protein
MKTRQMAGFRAQQPIASPWKKVAFGSSDRGRRSGARLIGAPQSTHATATDKPGGAGAALAAVRAGPFPVLTVDFTACIVAYLPLSEASLRRKSAGDCKEGRHRHRRVRGAEIDDDEEN